MEPSNPTSPGWDEALKKRHDAAEAWLTSNVNCALVIPLSVVKDLFPSGFDCEKFQPVLSKVMPGEIALSAERGSDNLFVLLKGG